MRKNIKNNLKLIRENAKPVAAFIGFSVIASVSMLFVTVAVVGGIAYCK